MTIRKGNLNKMSAFVVRELSYYRCFRCEAELEFVEERYPSENGVKPERVNAYYDCPNCGEQYPARYIEGTEDQEPAEI